MSAAETLPANLPAPLKKILILLLSTAIGAAAGTGLVRLMGRLHMPTRSLTAFDVIALAIAVTFLAMAAVIALTSASRKQLARQMEGDEARLPATLEEVRSYRRPFSCIGWLHAAGAHLCQPRVTRGRHWHLCRSRLPVWRPDMDQRAYLADQ